MITSLQDYNQKLHLVYNQNPPTFALLSTDEPIYNINLQTRTVDVPKMLGVEKDHCAETIYFRIDRFADYMDLATTSCVIYYINAKGESGIHIPKFYDVFTEQADNKILIPWTLDNHVMAKEGAITFSIRFFKTGLQIAPNQPTEPIMIYNLNLLPATTNVLKGINIKYDIDAEEESLPASWTEQLQNQIDLLKQSAFTTWTILD